MHTNQKHCKLTNISGTMLEKKARGELVPVDSSIFYLVSSKYRQSSTEESDSVVCKQLNPQRRFKSSWSDI